MKELERVDKQIEKMMKNNQSDFQTYMKDGIEGLYNKRYDAGKSKMMAGMNDMQQAMADIENASKAYEDAMKNGDEEAANAALGFYGIVYVGYDKVDKIYRLQSVLCGSHHSFTSLDSFLSALIS